MTRRAIAETGVPEEDMEGIAAVPRQIEGVDVAVILQQKAERRWRVSMRSSEHVNSSAVCARLGGGGHARAAGCTLQGTLEEVKARLVEELRTELTPV
ncbi:MAG: DHH family phosphoesterase [Anaerotruncus massiliensis (ex Togo et al. 2019)]